MRILLGILVLACLFGLAALWHGWTIAEARQEQEHARAIAEGTLASTEVGELRDGQAVLLFGRPSGQAPIEGARIGGAGVSTPPPAALPPPTDPASGAPPSELADFTLTVKSGQSLSKIAAAHYGSAANDLVQALARYNGLKSADQLKAGQTLRLPAKEKLLAPGH